MKDIIYSADPGLIIGFHGCDEAVCQAVVSGKESLRCSNNSWDWLGDGIYFWQNNYERAWDYANHPPGGLIIKRPAVIGAVFSLGNCLDLTDKKSIDIVSTAFEYWEDSSKAEQKDLPVNDNPSSDPHSEDKVIRCLDCTVIKKVHELSHERGQTPFDSVRAVFPEGDPLYAGAGFKNKTHIQVAIRNPNVIKGYFIPRRATAWTGFPIPPFKQNRSNLPLRD